MDRPDVVHAEPGEQLAGDLQPAEGIVEHVPFVRVAQAQRIRREEHRCRHPPRPVEGERVHRVQDAVLHRVEELEVADHVLGAERLESQLAAGLVGDAVTPVLEDLEADAARPRGLHLPCGGLRLGGADIGESDGVGATDDGGGAADRRRGLEEAPAGFDHAFDRFAESALGSGLFGHNGRPPCWFPFVLDGNGMPKLQAPRREAWKTRSRVWGFTADAGAATEAPMTRMTTTPHACPSDMSAAIRRSLSSHPNLLTPRLRAGQQNPGRFSAMWNDGLSLLFSDCFVRCRTGNFRPCGTDFG